MRYLLHKTQWGELPARQKYLYDVSHLYFCPGNPEGQFIPLNAIGTNRPSVLFVTGHTNSVNEYLMNSIDSIPERIIVITSCIGHLFRKYSAKKEIYVPNSTQPLCLLRDGQQYGFGFDISDAELNLYNSSGSIIERIQSAYIRLQ